MAYQDDSEEQEIHLGISQGFQDLLSAEFAVLNTSLVDTDVLQQGNLLIVRHPLSLHRGVRKKDDDARADDDGDQTESQKHSAPSRETSVGAHVLEAKRHKTTDDLTETQTKIPEGEARRRLGFSVPHTADNHQTWCNRCLEDTQEDAGDKESLIVGGRGTAGGSGTPEDHIEAEPFCGRNGLKEPNCKVVLLVVKDAVVVMPCE